MRRLRRRLLLSIPIALVMGLFGGAPVGDLSTFTLRMRGHSDLPKTSLSKDFALAPIDPVVSEGLTSDVAVLNGNPPAEAIIKTAPTEFRGAAPRRSDPPAQLD